MVKELPLIPIDETPPQDRRISWWFENTIIRAIKRILNATGNFIRNLLTFSLTDWIEDMEQGMIEILRPYIDYLSTIPNLPPYLMEVVNRAASGQHQAGLAALALLIPVLYQALSQGISEPIAMITRAVMNKQLRPTVIDPGLAIEMLNKEIIEPSEFTSIMQAHGYNNDAILRFILNKTPLYNDSQLTTALWRDLMDESTINQMLSHRGYNEQQTALWKEERNLIPSPQDLVSMATREAFNDAAAQRFGYDDDFPTDAAEWAEKGGLSSEWFLKYWRAHWRLPGLVQVREMFHRQIIEEEDVKAYLLAADIPSFWREAIIKWMYKEVTRVDLRRMYDKGIISLGEVYTAYLKQGYAPDDAENMSIWTGMQYADETRELTKTDILGMYRDGILSESEVRDLMTSLGYNISTIILLMAREDLKQHAAYEQKIISNVQKLYVAELISRTDVYAELGKLDTPGHFIAQSLEVWDLEKKAKLKRPTITQLRDMVLSETIPLEVFRGELSAMKYSDLYIEWYIQHWKLGG